MTQGDTLFLVVWHPGMNENSSEPPRPFDEDEQSFVQAAMMPLTQIASGSIGEGTIVFDSSRFRAIEGWLDRRLTILDARSSNVLRSERRSFILWYCLFLATIILHPRDVFGPNWPVARLGV